MRQSIRNIVGYRAAGQKREPVNALLRSIAESKGLACCSIGPYYLPEPVKPTKFTMAAVVPMSDGQLRVMRRIGRVLGISSYGVNLPQTYGEPVGLVNLETREGETVTLTEFQNRVMASIAPYLQPYQRWNPVTMSDNTKPQPLVGDTKKLLDCRNDWLDYMIRTVESDNITKLDIDNVIYDPKTSRPLLIVEAKASGAALNSRITVDMARALDARGGLIHYDADTETWGYFGFGFSARSGCSQQAVRIFISNLLEGV